MTENEMKRLGRSQLLEILVDQSREIERLNRELDEMKVKLSERTLSVENSGSLAEASLKINGVFEAAQKAADDYVENVRHRMEAYTSRIEDQDRDLARIKEETLAKCLSMEEETKKKCRELEERAVIYFDEMERKTKEKCALITEDARQTADSYWQQVRDRLNIFIEDHKGLKEILSQGIEAKASSTDENN